VIGRAERGASEVDTETAATSFAATSEGVTSAGESKQQRETETFENSVPAGGISGIAIPESAIIGYMLRAQEPSATAGVIRSAITMTPATDLPRAFILS
jgi:hypothetical protein